jgi:Ca2+:H+ antiporter
MNPSPAHKKPRGLLHEAPWWTIVAPFFGAVTFTLSALHAGGGALLLSLVAAGLTGSVFAAVHHAEVVAHRIGEPYGTLVLALAVTLIEVALIVSLMLAGGDHAAALARDTVFAAVMILLNGILGLCLLVGGFTHREQSFSLEGVSAALPTLGAILALTLIFPNYTVTTPGPFYSSSQLTLIACVSLVIYGAFVFTQTVGHRQYFLEDNDDPADAKPHVPGGGATILSACLLLVCLTAVVLLAKKLAPSLEAAVSRAGAPNAMVGVIIAAIVLLPEGLAALRAARANRLQTSLNLALGSALASIGLTIPAVSVLSLVMHTRLILGIDAKQSVLLLLSLFVAALALRTGRTIILHGVILLVVFVVYLFTIVVP